MRVSLPFVPLQIFILMPLGWGAGTQGGEPLSGTCTHAGTVWHLSSISWTPSRGWSQPSSSVWETHQNIFSITHPQWKNLGNIIAVEGVIGTGEWTRAFHKQFYHHSSWNTNQEHLLRTTQSCRTQGQFSIWLWSLVLHRTWTEPISASFVSPITLGLQTSVSGNFNSKTGRMNKYLVTSLIMWITTCRIILM